MQDIETRAPPYGMLKLQCVDLLDLFKLVSREHLALIDN